jgi:hypothetical protein
MLVLRSPPSPPALVITHKSDCWTPSVLETFADTEQNCDNSPTVTRESQRDSVLQPRVARNELPWVMASQPFQPQRGCGPLVSFLAPNVCHNPVGVDPHDSSSTQGSSCVATLGCLAQSLWDWTDSRFEPLNHDQVSSDGTYGTCSAPGENRFPRLSNVGSRVGRDSGVQCANGFGEISPGTGRWERGAHTASTSYAARPFPIEA